MSSWSWFCCVRIFKMSFSKVSLIWVISICHHPCDWVYACIIKSVNPSYSFAQICDSSHLVQVSSRQVKSSLKSFIFCKVSSHQNSDSSWLQVQVTMTQSSSVHIREPRSSYVHLCCTDVDLFLSPVSPRIYDNTSKSLENIFFFYWWCS